MKQKKHFTSLFFVVFILTGCVRTNTEFPDLALRDFERDNRYFSPTPLTSEITARADSLDYNINDINTLFSLAHNLHEDFMAYYFEAQKVVSNIQEVSVEKKEWASAQIEIAGLYARNAAMKFVIADIDVILLDTSRETIEFEELSVIQKRVEYLEQDQQEKISQLVSAVSPSI